MSHCEILLIQSGKLIEVTIPNPILLRTFLNHFWHPSLGWFLIFNRVISCNEASSHESSSSNYCHSLSLLRTWLGWFPWWVRLLHYKFKLCLFLDRLPVLWESRFHSLFTILLRAIKWFKIHRHSWLNQLNPLFWWRVRSNDINLGYLWDSLRLFPWFFHGRWNYSRFLDSRNGFVVSLILLCFPVYLTSFWLSWMWTILPLSLIFLLELFV